MSSMCKDVIRVDIDIPYNIFMDYVQYYEMFIEYVLRKLVNANIKYVKYYKSSHGNTHVYIHVDKCIDLNMYHIVQFFVYNDHKRTMLNYERFKRFGNHFDFLFPA